MAAPNEPNVRELDVRKPNIQGPTSIHPHAVTSAHRRNHKDSTNDPGSASAASPLPRVLRVPLSRKAELVTADAHVESAFGPLEAESFVILILVTRTSTNEAANTTRVEADRVLSKVSWRQQAP